MTGLVFVAVLAGLPVLGWGLIPRRVSSWLPAPAGLAVAAGLGALAIGIEMSAMSAVGIRWTVPRIAAAPLLLTGVRLSRVRRGTSAGSGRLRPGAIGAAAIAAGVLLVAYAAMTARATSADLVIFWGAKAERFAAAGGIDVAFLRDPNHWALHSDYPPLLQCLWALASLAAGRFSWGASLATLPIFAGYLVVAAWGLSRLEQDENGAAASAALVAALLTAVLPYSGTAGNAEPLLLFFEGTALLLLLFGRGRPGAAGLAGLLLAAGVWTKFEGTFFAAALVTASLLAGRPRRWRDAAILATLPAAALLSWLAFCRWQRLSTYLGHAPRLYLDGERLAVVGRELLASATFGLAYTPWVLAATLLVLGRPSRPRLTLALGAAALTTAADTLIYLTSPDDPTMWVRWSGTRLLLTPLFCLYAGAIAAPGGAAALSRFRDDRTRNATSAAPAA